MTDHCVVDADRQVLRCDHCGLEIALPMPEGDAFQDGGELAEFVMAVAEIARKEAP